MKKIFTSLSLFATLLVGNNVHAQGETCANAIAVTPGNYTSNGPTTGNGASAYSGDTHSDWYSFTATQNGVVTISSCGSGNDSRLFGFTGTCSNLINVIDADDDCSANEIAAYVMNTGEVLYFEWSDAYSSLPVTFTVSFGPLTTAGNDCANATAVTPGSYISDGPTTGNGASAYSGDIHSDWYSFTATQNGLVTISSCGSGNDSRLFGFTGTCSNLNNVIDADDDCGGNEIASYAMNTGDVLYFEWTDAYSSSPVAFTVTFGSLTAGGDNCANATAVNLGTYTSDGPTTGNGASSYSGDLHSDWFSFIPPATDSYTISSCLSGNDTRLYVFDGTCAALNNIADRDDDCGANEEVTLTLTGGTTYYIEWSDSYSSAPVNFTISGMSVSLEDESLNEVNIYPNPTFDGKFTVEVMEDSDTEIKIVNALGAVIYEAKTSSKSLVDINQQPAGWYFVIINSNGMTTTKKILKK